MSFPSSPDRHSPHLMSVRLRNLLSSFEIYPLHFTWNGASRKCWANDWVCLSKTVHGSRWRWLHQQQRLKHEVETTEEPLRLCYSSWLPAVGSDSAKCVCEFGWKLNVDAAAWRRVSAEEQQQQRTIVCWNCSFERREPHSIRSWAVLESRYHVPRIWSADNQPHLSRLSMYLEMFHGTWWREYSVACSVRNEVCPFQSWFVPSFRSVNINSEKK